MSQFEAEDAPKNGYKDPYKEKIDTLMSGLEDEWKTQAKRNNKMTEGIRALLSIGDNPYIVCLDAMQCCWEFSKSRAGQTLCHQFLQVILELRQANDPSVSLDKLTDDVKMTALDTIIKQANQSLVELTCKTFLIDRSCATIFRPVVMDLITKKFFVEAASVVNQLGLREEFVEGLAIPLLLMDKIPLLEACLEGLPEVQKAVIRGFDDVFEDSSKMQGIIKKLGLKTDKKGDQHLWKMMSKLMTRLLKKYGLPADLCPRLQLSRNRITLRYMLHKKYRDRDVAESSWREMVYDQVSNFRVLHSELMRDLVNYDDLKTGHFFALKLGLPRNLWPGRLHEYVRSLPPGTPSPLDEDESINNNHRENDERAGNYLQLGLSSDQINMVQTRDEFLSAVKMLSEAPLIGVDAEWKPAMGFMQQTRLSLLQMATHTNALLFDVLALVNVISKEDWESFFGNVFENSNVTILGYGLAEDLLKLERLTTVPIVSRNLVDLHSVQAALIISRPDLMAPKVPPSRSGAPQPQNTGLSRLTQTLLGYPLDKAEQCSDWENRPLRTTQINYAALDAHCLLMCWDELASRCQPDNLSEIIQQALKEREQPDQNQTDGNQQSPRNQSLNGYHHHDHQRHHHDNRGAGASRGRARGGASGGGGGGGARSANSAASRSTSYHHNQFPLLASLGVGYTERAAAAFQPGENGNPVGSWRRGSAEGTSAKNGVWRNNRHSQQQQQPQQNQQQPQQQQQNQQQYRSSGGGGGQHWRNRAQESSSRYQSASSGASGYGPAPMDYNDDSSPQSSTYSNHHRQGRWPHYGNQQPSHHQQQQQQQHPQYNGAGTGSAQYNNSHNAGSERTQRKSSRRQKSYN